MLELEVEVKLEVDSHEDSLVHYSIFLIQKNLLNIIIIYAVVDHVLDSHEGPLNHAFIFPEHHYDYLPVDHGYLDAHIYGT